MFSGKFKIVVPTYNVEKWLEKTLSSIEDQTYKNFDVCVIDDCSTQEEGRDIIRQFCGRNSWEAIFNKENVGALHNIVIGTKHLNPDDHDVIVNMDGDDWFSNPNALQRVADTYNEQDIHMSYGSFTYWPSNKMGFTMATQPEVIKNRSYRRNSWIYMHLRTYKYLLWKNIKDEDLREPDGKTYIEASWDVAFMYPMLEMCDGKFAFIRHILYNYNVANPLNDEKIKQKKQIQTVNRIKSMPRYDPLPNI